MHDERGQDLQRFFHPGEEGEPGESVQQGRLDQDVHEMDILRERDLRRQQPAAT